MKAFKYSPTKSVKHSKYRDIVIDIIDTIAFNNDIRFTVQLIKFRLHSVKHTRID